MKFRIFPALGELPAVAGELWKEATKKNIFLCRDWFETVIDAALDPQDEVVIGCLEEAGRIVAIIPCRFTRSPNRLEKRRLHSLTGPYSCLFRPLVAEGFDEMATAQTLGRELGGALTRNESIWLDTLDPEWPAINAFESGLIDTGLITFRYNHFGSWYEKLGGGSFDDYAKSRGGALLEILRRKGAAAQKRSAQYQIISSIHDVDRAVTDYEEVYRKSWKVPEPYPNFHPVLIHKLAHLGALRMGILRIGVTPIAVQLWTSWNGTGTVLKLAHDEAYSRLSPGSLLLAYMIKALREHDAVSEINFGRGDDGYKRLWASQRRQFGGLVAANARSASGAVIILRQMLSQTTRPLRTKLFGRN